MTCSPGRDHRLSAVRRAATGLGAVALLLLLPSCEESTPPPHLAVPGGDAARGRVALMQYGCNGCHSIPGVRGVRGWVGPPLINFARRGYIAGQLPNRPVLLVAWIMNPPALVPGTAMPAVGASETDARDMAAYLYTLGAGEAWEPQVVLNAPLARPELLAAYRAAEQQRLQGTVPIDRAMEILVERERLGQP
jgi:cytochrome c2